MNRDATGDGGFATRSIHGGQRRSAEGGKSQHRALAPPLFQTVAYEFPDAEYAAALYALASEDDIYTRISNPTVRLLERRLASLEGGVDAVATASGMAAFDALVLVLAEAGNNVVTASSIYGGTSAYLERTASRRGIESRFVDTLAYDEYDDAVDDDTAFVHLETIGNPSLVTADLARIADIAHDHGVPLVVDNTFATPALCRPLEHGADVVWESTTKWLHGAGTTVGGVVVDGGTFPWADHDYPEVGAPNPAFHGTNFSERFGERALAAAVRQRGVRSLGSCQSPFDAWVTLQGLQTLSLRMRRHSETARLVADFLSTHPAVEWVSYPGLADHETHEEASNYLDGGYGGMIAFGLEGGYEAGKRFCESVGLAVFAANVGDARTHVIHPASTTHAQLSPEGQLAAGVTRDLVRLSVGLEAPDDVLRDVELAIEEAT